MSGAGGKSPLASPLQLTDSVELRNRLVGNAHTRAGPKASPTRRTSSWSTTASAIAVIGDAVVPHRVPHAIAEGRAAAEVILAGQVVGTDRPTAAGAGGWRPRHD
jgi:hypothetical protein